jgi:phage tail-like protein
MIEKFPVPELALAPPVGFSFLVIFYGIGNVPIPNGLDIRFQKVSGLSTSFENEQEEVQKGSINQIQSTLPGRRNYPKLILERALIIGVSPLAIELQNAVAYQTLKKHDLQVFLLNQMLVPIGSWFFSCAYPVSWSISDLDANQNQVLIETLEMKYQHFRTVIL